MLAGLEHMTRNVSQGRPNCIIQTAEEAFGPGLSELRRIFGWLGRNLGAVSLLLLLRLAAGIFAAAGAASAAFSLRHAALTS